jgi:hypothetical protein
MYALRLATAGDFDAVFEHLQVRLDNPAMRLYERAGFVMSPRVVMTKTL